MDRGVAVAVRIYVKYRCMTCEGTPTIGEADAALVHITENVGHELTQRTTSETVPDPEPEGES